LEIKKVLDKYLTVDTIKKLDSQAFDEFPEKGMEVCILINGKGELDGIDVN